MAIDKKNKDSEHIALPKDGAVSITAQPTDVTEKEVYDDRQAIISKLKVAYVDVAKTMKPFQSEWDNSHVIAMGEALYDGAKAGMSEWGDDNAELLKLDTWKEMAHKISHAAGTAYDAATQYSAMQQKKIVKSVNEALYSAEELAEHPSATFKTWGWHMYDDVIKSWDDAKQYASHTAQQVGESAVKAEKIYRHKDAILELPIRVARGDINGIEQFIDTVLMDIDPVSAKAIKTNPNYPYILEVIADHDSAMAYYTYAGLIYESIPLNFYAYIAVKGAIYLVLEVILTIVLALFTEGVGAAARLGMLATRIATIGNKVAKFSKKAEQLQLAIASFTKMLRVFEEASHDLLLLGKKLNRVRARKLVLKGETKTTLKAERKLESRVHHCMICGSTKHATPHGPRGNIQYD